MARFLKQLFEQGAWQSRLGPLAAMIGIGLGVIFMVYLTTGERCINPEGQGRPTGPAKKLTQKGDREVKL